MFALTLLEFIDKHAEGLSVIVFVFLVLAALVLSDFADRPRH